VQALEEAVEALSFPDVPPEKPSEEASEEPAAP
jgi:hypothetical protein